METRIRVAGIWLSDNAVLLESLHDRDIWGLPGGRLEDNESLEDGCQREYQEELGIRTQCQGLAIVNENFWEDKGRYIREYGFYFYIEPVQRFATPRPSVQSQEGHLKFEWFELDRLDTLVVVPAFLRGILPKLGMYPVFIHSED